MTNAPSLAVKIARAAERVKKVFFDRTSIHMDPRIAEAIAQAVLTKEPE